jgi:hypothetical protein
MMMGTVGNASAAAEASRFNSLARSTGSTKTNAAPTEIMLACVTTIDALTIVIVECHSVLPYVRRIASRL